MTKKTTFAMTLESIQAEIDKQLKAYAEADDTKKVDINADLKDLVADYNELLVLTRYAEFFESEMPMVDFLKAHHYKAKTLKNETIKKVVDGVSIPVNTKYLDEKETLFDLFHFLDYAKKCNKKVAASDEWRDAVDAFHDAIQAEWKKFFAGEKNEIDVKSLAKIAQVAVDSLVLIKGKKGNNAVVAKDKNVRTVFGTANILNRKNEVENLPVKVWKPLLLNFLHNSVEGKEFTIEYGENVEEKLPNTEKFEAKTTPAEAKAEVGAEVPAHIEAEAEAIANAPADVNE